MASGDQFNRAEADAPNSKPMPGDCEEEDYCRDEGSKPNHDSPDKGCRFFFVAIAMGMPLHLNVRHDTYGAVCQKGGQG